MGSSLMGAPIRRIIWRLGLAATTLVALVQTSRSAQNPKRTPEMPSEFVSVDPTIDLGSWQGWGSSLAWWGRAVGGTENADYYADLIYTTKDADGVPGLGLNVVRYNVGGGGIDQRRENKGQKLQWQMDIHGYWTDPNTRDPANWNWSVDENQRVMMQKARDRGANVFDLFSDSPMWWMNANLSTAGSDTGRDCLTPDNYDRFAFYLASVARHAADDWGIKFNSVEPFNEPSANWWKYPGRQEGCHFDVATQQLIVQRLRHALDEARLADVAIAVADENNIDAGLNTWNTYSSETRSRVGRVNVHGYSNGTDPYRGLNRRELRRVVGSKPIFLSEYGDADASGYTLADEIVRDLKELRPKAWVYWQPVEPDVRESGWGLINAQYVDTRDEPSKQKTRFVRVNRKFFVFGQFTRYIRSGYHLVEIADPNAIAAYDGSHTLVIAKLTGDSPERLKLALSVSTSLPDTVEVIATTTAPGGRVPDWKQHHQMLELSRHGDQKLIETDLYPKSVYTFVLQDTLH
jgi:galactan endo-1,6-beta-galactosidase